MRFSRFLCPNDGRERERPIKLRRGVRKNLNNKKHPAFSLGESGAFELSTFGFD